MNILNLMRDDATLPDKTSVQYRFVNTELSISVATLSVSVETVK